VNGPLCERCEMVLCYSCGGCECTTCCVCEAGPPAQVCTECGQCACAGGLNRSGFGGDSIA
jgi:hypothetical protein